MATKDKIYSFLETTGEKIFGSDESKEYNINCFLCTDKRHRLGINKETENWNCFNCSARGKKLKNLEWAFKNRKKVKNNDTIKKTEKEIKCRIKPDFHKQFTDMDYAEGEKCIKYLHGRGISDEAIKYFELGSRWEFKGRKGKYDAGDHLVIPYIKEGKCVNVKYRKLNPDVEKNDKWKREEGGISILYNDAVIDDFNYNELIIVESEIDTISLWEMGFKNVVGLTTGASGFKNKPEWVDRLERFEKIYIILDNDEAGQLGARNLATILGLGRCYNVTLPDGIKDPNDLLNSKKYNKAFLTDLLAHGSLFEVRNTKSLKQYNSEFYYEKFIAKERESVSKYDTPWHQVNNILGPLNNGYLFVLGGKPKCFMHDSKIIDGKTGHRITIDKAVKDRVSSTYSLNEKTKKICKEEITDWIDSGIKECFEIETALGRKIRLTGCHPLLKFDGWAKVSDIVTGDYIAVPTSYGEFGKLSWDNRKTHLVAALVADGCTTQNTPRYYKNDKKLISIINRATTYFDGLTMNKLSPKYTYSFTTLGVSHNPLNDLIKTLNLDTLSKNKVLPDVIFEFDRDTLANFIGMLWSHDGSIFLKGNKTSIEYTCASEELIDQLVTLLLKFGISIRKRKRIIKLKGKKFKAYSISSAREATVKQFLSMIPLFCDKCDVDLVFGNAADRDYLTSFPKEVWAMIRSEALSHNISWCELKTLYWGTGYTKVPSFKTNGNCSKATLTKINKIINSEKLNSLITGDIGFTKVTNITPIGKHQCYDVTVPEHSNLIVDDIVAHNCGKTTLCVNLMKHWGKRSINCAIYSCEMRGERLQEKWLMSEPNTLPSRNGVDYIDELQFHRASLRLPSNKINIFNPTIQNDILIDGVVENVESMVKRFNLKIVVVDNLHYLCRGGDENAMVSEATQKLKLLAERLDIMIVLVTHPKKTNTNKQLQPEDLKGSSSIIQDADVIWLQHRPFQNDDMKEDEIKTGYAKHDPMNCKTDISVIGRFTDGGKTFLYFSGSYSTFKDSGIGYNSIVSEFGNSKVKRKKRGL